jgi:conjugative transfer pilus assembly protein TraH
MRIFSYLLIVLALWHQAAIAGFAQDWIDQSTWSGPETYQTQQRGFYSLGTYSARWQMSNDPIAAVNLPSIEAGCGGIDAFGGSIALMSPEMLTQKLQNVLQAAPAVALDMAIKTLSKDSSDSMKSIEAIANRLNGLQFNDCALAKKAVTMMVDPENFGDHAEEMWAEIDSGYQASKGNTDSYTENKQNIEANNGTPATTPAEHLEGCPAEFKAIFGGGSLVGNAAAQMGLAPYADKLRGMIGDVEITFGATNLPTFKFTAPCGENDSISTDDIVEDKIYARSAKATGNETCALSPDVNLRTYAGDMMVSIVDKIKTPGTPLTAAETAFINKTEIPIFSMLTDAVAVGQEATTIGTSEGIIAYNIAWNVMSDMHQQLSFMLNKAKEIGGNTTPAPGLTCNVDLILPAMQELPKLQERLNTTRTLFEAARLSELQKYNAYTAMLEYQRTAAQRARAERAKRMKVSE